MENTLEIRVVIIGVSGEVIDNGLKTMFKGIQLIIFWIIEKDQLIESVSSRIPKQVKYRTLEIKEYPTNLGMGTDHTQRTNNNSDIRLLKQQYNQNTIVEFFQNPQGKFFLSIILYPTELSTSARVE